MQKVEKIEAAAPADIEQSMLVENLAAMTQTIAMSTFRGQISDLLADDATGMHQVGKSLDELTGLPNKMLFYDRVRQALSTARREGDCVGVISADVNLVRRVKNNYESVEDEVLLKSATARVSEILRETDPALNDSDAVEQVTISRLDNTEFGVSL